MTPADIYTAAVFALIAIVVALVIAAYDHENPSR